MSTRCINVVHLFIPFVSISKGVIPLKRGILSGMNEYYIYIMASSPRGILYTGITNNLVRRVWEHKNEFVDSFSKKYQTKRLVYFEQFTDVEYAIKREKQLKHWNRQWKINLISKTNPKWDDLYQAIL
jgi:putative endonuclease